MDLCLKAALLLVLTLALPGLADNKKPLSKQEKEFVKRCTPVLQGKWHSISLKPFPLNDGYKRTPIVSFIIQEDGSVTDVKIKRSSGSLKVDRNLVEQTALNRYNKRPGCGQLTTDMMINIDWGS